AVRLAHQRLRGEMEDDVGLGFRHGTREVLAVAHVALDVAELLGEAKQFEVALVVERRQGIARHVGTELEQPGRQPRALEAGMAGHEDVLALVKISKHVRSLWQSVQGFRPWPTPAPSAW